jgi:predicted nuclease of predicted toxin-antitoxin system
VKFLADMGVSMRTVTWLRQKGYDAVHLREEGLQRLPDHQIMGKAVDEKRIVLTIRVRNLPI